jgi:N-acetylmuramoyl-L-alanine amidase
MKQHLRVMLGSTVIVLFVLLIIGSASTFAQGPDESLLCFRRGGEVACIRRALRVPGDFTTRLRATLQALVAGPTPSERAAGLSSAIPARATLAQVDVVGVGVNVYLILPEPFLRQTLDPLLCDQLVEQIVRTVHPFRSALRAAAGIRAGAANDRLIVHILAQDPWDPAHPFRDLASFLNEPPVERKGGAVTPKKSTTTSLAGKAIYLSAGHGYYWNASSSKWLTQRPVWDDLVEDFNNAEVVNQYLISYLLNAGADVFTVRERDMNTHEITATVGAPGYAETGTWLDGTDPITKSSLIFPWRYASTNSTATATATWTLTPTQTARYTVYAWYVDGANRAPDARYRIEHAGGVVEVKVDQGVHAVTWRPIGVFPFYANQPVRITLTNVSVAAGRVVTAGAVRIGGGMGSMLGGGPPSSTATSGRPRYEEASRYWAQFEGAPASVYNPHPGGDNLDDVTARPRYAEWEHPAGEDALFVSWHSNGSSNHDVRGTESYIYDGTMGGMWSSGSDYLQYYLHTSLVNDIQSAWDENWVDRGMLAANFGEVRLLSTMPGTLLEIAYHDNRDEANALVDPRFAQITARAIYRGIVRYFAGRDQTTPVFLPEPPAGLAVRNSAPGQVTLTWLPSPTDGDGPLGDAAAGYHVYTSPDGFAWDAGVSVTTTYHTLPGLTAGQLIFVRVTGINAGGESLPSFTMAARAPASGNAAILLVEGYTRNDRSNATWQNDGISISDTVTTGPSLRLYADRTNRQDYAIQHGFAISRSFDSTTRSLLGNGGVNLNGYAVVVWMAGEESSSSDTIPIGIGPIALTSAEQSLLATFVSRGGSLLMSGAEVGRDLVMQNKGPAFYRDTLKAFYQGSDAMKLNPPDPYPNRLYPVPGGIFDGMSIFYFDNGTHGTYNADRVDYFIPLPEDRRARSALTYQAAIGSAALAWNSGGCARVVYLAFPFETIYPAETRAAVMTRLLDYLSVCGPQWLEYLPWIGR